MTYKSYLAGFVTGIAAALGCASTNLFPYKYYNASMPDDCYDKGTLLGKLGANGWPDLSLSECKPDPTPSPGASPSPGPLPDLEKCVTMNVQDFYNMKAAFEVCQNDLVACQHGPPPQ